MFVLPRVKIRGIFMIKLTIQGVHGEEFYLNPHQIELIHANVDTAITLLSGKVILVKEDIDTIYTRIVAYRKEIGCFKNEE